MSASLLPVGGDQHAAVVAVAAVNPGLEECGRNVVASGQALATRGSVSRRGGVAGGRFGWFLIGPAMRTPTTADCLEARTTTGVSLNCSDLTGKRGLILIAHEVVCTAVFEVMQDVNLINH